LSALKSNFPVLLATWHILSMITALGSYGYYLHAHQNAAKAAVLSFAIEVCFSNYVVVMQLQLKYITSCAEPLFSQAYALI